MNQAEKKRLYRLKNRIYNMIKDNIFNCLFITFTFTNDILENTTEQTRLRYIKAYLNSQTNEYILNRDYGKTTEREHYHAIVKLKDSKLVNFKAYRYGQIRAERLNQLKRFTKNNKTIKEIANDLMIHATKQSTKGAKIIYSRTTKPKNDILQEIYDYLDY